MKKMLCMFVVFVMLMSCLPVTVSASSSDKTDLSVSREEAVEIACEVFPEYADKITTEFSRSRRAVYTDTPRELVREITRNVSENAVMTYAEYSDGMILLSLTNDDFPYSEATNSLVIDGSITHIDITVRAYCSYVSGTFTLSGVKFDISANGYDRFTNTGTANVSGNVFVHRDYPTTNMIETATTNAKIIYRLHWIVGAAQIDSVISYLTIEVGDNRFVISHEEG